MRVIAAALAAVIWFSEPVRAEQLAITSAHPDVAAGMLVVDGTGFRPGLSLALEGRDLKVLSVRPREIKAALPRLHPGTYRLVVREWFESARFVVAIGDTATPGPASTPGLTVVASNGNTLGTVVGVTKLFGTDPAVVARQDNGVWIALGIDANGVVPGSFPIFYAGDGCTGDAYAMFESNPAPLFRAVQRMTATDTTGFYPGNPPQSLSFPAMQIEDPMNPGARTCVSPEAAGWGGSRYVGPLQTIDLSLHPAPFTVQ